MHRRTPLLIAVLLVVGLASWGLAQASSPQPRAFQRATPTEGPSPTATSTPVCPTCKYVPLVRYLFVPSATPTSTPIPTATAAPTPTAIVPSVHVRSYRMFPDSIGDLIVAGEIENTTNKPVYDVKVIAKFYNGAGAFVATDYTYVLFDLTDPGQRTPFRLYLSNAPADVARVDLTLNLGTAFLTYRYAAVISQQARNNSGVEVFGEVQNVAAKDLKYTKVVVTFYDSAGAVYDTDYSYAAINQIPPGSTSTYQVSTFDSQLAGLAYSVQAQGYLAP